MTIDLLKRIALFLILCLAQALVFNRIRLFDCATPLLYVYFVLTFRRNYPRWAILLWSFALGLTVDMFANTPGIASTSLTLLGVTQPYVLTLFLPRDAEESALPSVAGLGWGKFLTYALLMVLVYCLLFFSLEAFNYFNWLYWLECLGGSLVLTVVLIMALESWRG